MRIDDGWMEILKYGWMERWMDEWMDGWTDGWMKKHALTPVCITAPTLVVMAEYGSGGDAMSLSPPNSVGRGSVGTPASSSSR